MSADRSAGRWCEECQEHGSHHTERHGDYQTYAQNAAMWRLTNALVSHRQRDDCAGCFMHPTT